MAEENYHEMAEDDARETVEEFLDTIVEALIDKHEASDDLNNDYPNGDSYHHERHVDQSYSLLEAAQLLDQLSEHEETDEGLWEGQSPREAVATQAAFTYGNAVYSEFTDMIKRINEEVESLADAGDIVWDAPEAKEGQDQDAIDEAHEKRLKRQLKRIVQNTVGIKPQRPRLGPQEWR